MNKDLVAELFYSEFYAFWESKVRHNETESDFEDFMDTEQFDGDEFKAWLAQYLSEQY